VAGSVVFDEQTEIPLALRSLGEFRQWAASDSFPQRGRFDFLAGRIEVDMAPEDFFSHGTLKVELLRVLSQHVKDAGIGHLVTDRTRVSCPVADLSSEPDIGFVSHATLSTDRARLVPHAAGEPGRFVELEGTADLIVEIVSDRSVVKDTRRLPEAYFKAGVDEFWLVDARSEPLAFVIHRRGAAAFEPVESDADGFRTSAVFDCRFRLDGRRDAQGNWTFDFLQQR